MTKESMTPEQAEMFARLVTAAEQGGGGAACQLGDMYREGSGGVRYSPKQTFRWYARSALLGDACGQNNLGACYEHGLGCQQSYRKAVRWYRRSAKQGLSTASMNLGLCYLSGQGLTADRARAVALLKTAVAQGEEKAREELEKLGEFVEIPKVRYRRGIKIVDVTEELAGSVFGVVGIKMPRPSNPDQIEVEFDRK